MKSNDELRSIRRVLSGELDEFRVLVEQYQDAVFRLVRNIVGDRHDGEDVAQDVFVTAYEHLSSYDPSRSAFSTWLLTIARNKCLNFVKKRRPQASEIAEPVQVRTPATDAVEREFFEQLDRAMTQLPIEQRSAFVLSEIEKLSYQAIAVIEGTKIGTVKSRVNRAKRRLRMILQKTYEHT